MTAKGKKRSVAVAGCGASGMAAAIAAAQAGAAVTVFEKNDRAGKKLFLSGKGRCNLTNACDTQDFFASVLRGEKFLYSAVYGFDADRVRHFFTSRGCPLKTERGGRVFPVSDKSSDIIRVLTREMERLGVRVRYGCAVRELLLENGARPDGKDGAHDTSASRRVRGLVLADGTRCDFDAVIVCTGGLSYPATGSDGDGYRFAREAGHTVVSPRPSLVPLETKEDWCRTLQGLSLKNVRLYTLPEKKKKNRFQEQGEMLFTHFGVSGPLVLSASAYLADALGEGVQIPFAIDLKPALSPDVLDARLVRELEKNAHRKFSNAVRALFPASLVPVICALSEAGIPAEGEEDAFAHSIRIPAEQSAGTLQKKQRRAFAALIKRLPFTVCATRSFREAIVTAGGVALREIRPATMESKLCEGLYFAGEVADCDALTGGFNLQIAWSTGVLAGKSAAGGGDAGPDKETVL